MKISDRKWTPGPWKIIIDDDGNPLSGRPSVAAHEDLDCGIVHWDGFVQQYWRSARGDREIHANARLIAAAPELYQELISTTASLMAALSLLEKGGRRAAASNKMFEQMLEDYRHRVESARNVLAKARGEST